MTLKRSLEELKVNLDEHFLLQVVNGIFVRGIQSSHSIRHHKKFQKHKRVNRKGDGQYKVQD